MKVAALFSGGKDSAYAAYLARQQGHEISCMITAYPDSEESMLLHHPNARLARLQAESAGVPHVCADAALGDEAGALARLLSEAASAHGARGLVHGGVSSKYQKRMFEEACGTAGLEPMCPLWGADAEEYMLSMIGGGFEFVVGAVSAGGLGEEWLGKRIGAGEVRLLKGLSERHGFNLSFEGGEAETCVLDCPLFARPLQVVKSRTVWDGYRGRFEIVEAALGRRA